MPLSHFPLMRRSNMTEFASFLNSNKEKIESRMEEIVSNLNTPSTLQKAMGYSLEAGGKRLRPLLVMAVLHAFGKEEEIGLDTACAIEMIHTYSLIHDDLPCMDNDDLRRGKPTNHKVFGEGMAVLAGDALLTLAFEVIAKQSTFKIDPSVKLELVFELARAAGAEGMVGGQVADIEAEENGVDLQGLEYIHENKTGKLLGYSIMAGAILSGASLEQKEKLREFSRHLGLAFQIRDDILDVEGSESVIGKPVGSDVSNHKSTYPSLLTMDKAKIMLDQHIQSARLLLSEIDFNETLLLKFVDLVAKRDH